MTILHEDMPGEADGEPHTPNGKDPWEESHEPAILVRIWLSNDGRFRTHFQWAKEIEANGDPLCKPLEEMMAAAQALHFEAHAVMSAINIARQTVASLDKATRH